MATNTMRRRTRSRRQRAFETPRPDWAIRLGERVWLAYRRSTTGVVVEIGLDLFVEVEYRVAGYQRRALVHLSDTRRMDAMLQEAG